MQLQHPNIYAEFRSGKFVFHHSIKRFSGTPIDMTHEQDNKLVKVDGGVIGITSNENALNKWLVAGPEVFRLANEFHVIFECFNKTS